MLEDLAETADQPFFNGISCKSFLVTGANGFIARQIVFSLLYLNDTRHNGNHIFLLVRKRENTKRIYGVLAEREDVTIIEQDVCTPIPDSFDFDYIIHAASGAEAKYFDSDPIGVFNSNVIGTENIISYMNDHKCESAVYISSFTVYGKIESSVNTISEDYCGAASWNGNRDCYPYGKRSAEFLCMAASRQYNSPIKIVRPGFVYGASGRNDTRVYAEIIRNVADNTPITLQSAGHIYRSMIYVSDLVRGIFSVLFKGKNGEAYNIANEFASIRQFAEAAVEAADSPKVNLCFINPDDEATEPPKCLCGAMNISKISLECGWSPLVAIKDGIARSAKITAAEI